MNAYEKPSCMNLAIYLQLDVDVIFQQIHTELLQLQSDTHIFPAQSGVAVFTVNVSHCMESCQQQPLLSGTTAHINPEIKSRVTDQIFY